MVQPVDPLLAQFATSGANCITFHPEATLHVHRTIQEIKSYGCDVGIALNPATPLDVLDWILPELDLVLIMSVNPGFGGQAFLPAALDKLRQARAKIAGCSHPIRLQIDGGVNPDTIGAIAAAGADTFVAGSAIFQAENYAKAIAALRHGIAHS